MKKILILISLLLITGGFMPVFAANNSIVIIDFTRVMGETNIGKRMAWDFESTKKKKEDVLSSKRDIIISLDKQLKNEGNSLTDSRKLEIKQQLEKLQLDFKEEYEKTTKEIQELQKKFINEYNARILPLLKRFSEENKYSAVLSTVSVIWIDPSLDVTGEFVRKVNSEIK